MNLTRRKFLQSLSIGVVLTTKKGWANKLPTKAIERRDLFPQGVASGDPTADTVILWTRRPPVKGNIAKKLIVEISASPEFNKILAGGTANISADSDWTCRFMATDLKPERLWEVTRAESLRDKCLHKPGIVTEESKPTTQLSPLLYDLTSLQREANSRFGFSASNTLKIAQGLYERHKVLTYPRTDARALPEDYGPTVEATLKMLHATNYAPFADTILKNGWVKPNKRIFNNAKISDHFAIIPTTEPPKGLTEPEQKLYDMVTKRFLAIFYPAAEFLETTRITRVESEPFKTTGKVLVQPGWLAVYGKDAESEDTPSLAPVKANEQVETTAIEVKQSQTKPPPRFNEATLLSAMEGAGKLVEDDELREAMREKGLGTPATRATIIENLMAIGPIYGLTKSETAARTTNLLGLLDLTQGRHTVARNCSFGMRKKTALAMALLHKPRVLLLDEPFEGIDPASSAVIEMLLGQLSSDGATILLTSHILSIVQKTATRVVILHQGRVESDFSPSTADEGVEEVYFSIVGEPQPEVLDWLRS